jgi:hypothetical protein
MLEISCFLSYCSAQKKSKTVQSPFQLMTPQFPVNKFEETSSVPPGAHEDQFRRMRYPTEKSMQDPDRVFYTTTSMTEGVRFHPQPAWYYGYQNKTEPTDSCIVFSANRYGYRGARDIQQFHTAPYLPAEQTKHQHTPDFLGQTPVSNEWVPPIQAKPLTAGYALTSPKLWPENTVFVNGYEHKDPVPTSPLYIRETTVGSSVRPFTSPSILKIKEDLQVQAMILRENSKLESEGVIESRPLSQQNLLKKSWNEKLADNANPTLRQTMKRQVPPYEAHTLMDPTDTMRYSGSTAMIVHSSSAEELRFKLHMEMYRTNIPYDLRWKQVVTFYRILRVRLRREQSVEQAILEFAEILRKEALAHGQKASLLRHHFIRAMSTTELFEHLNPKQMSLLFSVFDPFKKSSVSFIQIVAAFTVLNQSPKYRDNQTAVLMDLWRFYEIYGEEQQPMDRAECVLCTCCGSAEDQKEILRLIKEVLRPVLYKIAVKSNQVPAELPPVAAPSSHIPSEIGLPSAARRVSGPPKGGVVFEPPTEKKKHLLIRPVYNIYDTHFDDALFRRLMSLCPQLVTEFNRQLTQRLVLCYGKDPRDLTEDISDQHSEKDFSWILTGKK